MASLYFIFLYRFSTLPIYYVSKEHPKCLRTTWTKNKTSLQVHPPRSRRPPHFVMHLFPSFFSVESVFNSTYNVLLTQLSTL